MMPDCKPFDHYKTCPKCGHPANLAPTKYHDRSYSFSGDDTECISRRCNRCGFHMYERPKDWKPVHPGSASVTSLSKINCTLDDIESEVIQAKYALGQYYKPKPPTVEELQEKIDALKVELETERSISRGASVSALILLFGVVTLSILVVCGAIDLTWIGR